METTEIIRILRQCGDCCLTNCEDCPDYKKAEEGFRDAKGFMWSCGGVLLDAADRLESLDKRWKITRVERDQARQMRERAERLLGEAQFELMKLRKVQKNGDLISREELEKALSMVGRMYIDGIADDKAYLQEQRVYEVLRNARAIEAEPVVHAHWVKNWCDNNLIGHEYEECSACGCSMLDTNQFWDSKRCPNCGAHMDEK